MLCFVFFFLMIRCLFFFNDTATTEIYTLSLHDALPIFELRLRSFQRRVAALEVGRADEALVAQVLERRDRSEEHTSELQSLTNLVCRLLLEKKIKFYLSLNIQIIQSSTSMTINYIQSMK